ncbi:neuropeptide Y receptor type 2 [Octopus bimaculoides]|uniref:G-protein coupled receptors family 1 profile domain-containing protein n=1 Tax=Octopus bimaculoides TaxID=37653 RepID=A0A0L8I745_OCTBM|nr:neuropeptide Y receptor type 2 [Octopus bimaculoides]|eukprot:XP_014789247.1 PREDICTED: neuropeptide Y receptor type 2-like [Octopus bimaculoides]
MNNSNNTIEDINREYFNILKPAFIFVSILLPIGLVGNSVALYIYGFRFQKLPVHIFLISLAVFDMIGCIFGIPLEMVALWYSKMYPSNILCKLEKFFIFYSSITSSITLFVIAVERYNKVCRHNRRQLSVRQAKIMTVTIGFLSVGFALPGALFFQRMNDPFSVNSVELICFYKYGYEMLQNYFLLSLGIDLLILTIMFILYHRIWKVAKEHYLPTNYAVNLNLNNMNARNQNTRTYAKIRQTNKILVCITLLFAISFIPGLILGITYPLIEGKHIPVLAEYFRHVVIRMWILNCTMNPIVYGLLNTRFRRIAKNIFFRIVCWKTNEAETTASSDTSR